VATGAGGNAGATASLPSGHRIISNVPSVWLKSMAPVPVPKIHCCLNLSLGTGMFSGTQAIRLLKCVCPSKWLVLTCSSPHTMHFQEHFVALLASSIQATRLTTRSICSFQCLWEHILGHVLLSPPGFAATTAAAPTRIHCPDTDNSCEEVTGSSCRGMSRITFSSPSKWLYRTRPPTTQVSSQNSSLANSLDFSTSFRTVWKCFARLEVVCRP
jgi:hypothetical protein